MTTTTTTTGEAAAADRAAYERDGFCVAPQVLDPAELAGACDVMDRIIDGHYATGVAPFFVDRRPGDPAGLLHRIDQPQMADHAVAELLKRSRIGESAAALTGADMVQVWAMQLIRKPPTAAATANVGWHQDDDYWDGWWDGDVFTCWLALSDVTADAGPVRFVRRSHRWGYLASGNFFVPELDDPGARYRIPDGERWDEVPAVMPPGGASFHHRRTIHGSGPNTSGGFRRSYAVHLRTDRCAPLPGLRDVYADQLTDPALSPVLFER